MNRKEAVDAIRSLSDAVIGECSTSTASENAMDLECAQIIQVLAPDLLDEREREILARRMIEAAA